VGQPHAQNVTNAGGPIATIGVSVTQGPPSPRVAVTAQTYLASF